MIEIKNPYNEETRRILVECRNNPSVTEQAVLDELECKSREFVQEKLKELGYKTNDVQNSIQDIKELPSLRKQYKEAIRLYRYLQDLVVEVREVKAIIRKSLGVKKSED